MARPTEPSHPSLASAAHNTAAHRGRNDATAGANDDGHRLTPTGPATSIMRSLSTLCAYNMDHYRSLHGSSVYGKWYFTKKGER
ncbi:hypothetical protein F7D09_0396 [Bifidobacterium leontopitheci]|uniref:Uncharacterized protein n=1 Tax=Bifidobacterium leontopitheci TaxID=2650774 RepID=A0A6I1GHB0_9BIFI|nr:hypothetical protein F7D09_0396 [Bifidobacterium leontopitheci]